MERDPNFASPAALVKIYDLSTIVIPTDAFCLFKIS